MPPKRRAADTETPNQPPTDVPPDPPGVPVPNAQPAPVKRQRVSRACDQCRAARERCDGKQPRCFPCISQSRPCTYEVSPKKRGVQTGYIRTLELALGWVFEKVPGSEETLGALLSQPGGQGHPVLGGKDPGGADRLQKRWRKSRVHRGIDRILSGESVPSLGQDEFSPPADASDTEADAARPRPNSDSITPGTETATQTPDAPRMGTGRCPPIALNDEPLRTDRERQVPASGMLQRSLTTPPNLKLPSNHWGLLDVYFSYTHSWLPILEKQALFQASYLYPEHGLALDPADASSAAHAELWAALALAAVQDAGRADSSSSGDADPHPREIYETARGLLPTENGPFQVHHARAFLLLSLVNLGEDKLTGAGMLIGSAIRILLDPNTHQHATQEKEGQKLEVAMMSCFLVDTALSVRCNRPPHLRVEDLAALAPVSENGPDQWEPWTACDGFGAGNTASRSSRSSAFCLSTFNQLYAMVKVVARETSMRRQGSLPGGGSGAFVARLQQAIAPNLPFSSFIFSPTCGTASVPTPYLARAVYLWASALAEPQSDTFLPLLQDTLDQYQRLFGRSSTPPLILGCISALANEEYLLRCSEQNRHRLAGLVPAYSSRRLDDGRSSSARGSHPIQISRPSPIHPEMPSSNQFPTPSNSMMNYPTPIMSSVFASRATTPHHQRLTTSRGGGGGYGSFLTTGMVSPYHPSFPNPVAMPQGTSLHMQHSGTAMAGMSGVATGMAPAHRDHYPSPTLAIPPLGFGHSPDYDALLDDLASIERADAVDLDTQFMTNLGFAPGCDINEILTRDFGGV
ncbi:hypothetical protein C8A05DRAFT_13572 [Staphylotrichum tortipilum]|uniref:Zn(2)-C6 fungal-type domain-containing protein n=1 Tax=Staphylotrichum tortipilum TaxID=2831512 RepID=A0AAN6MQG7_9PEZI|nr:hypothetical protein C8A05DRAFT_13572 [Staphylotrichum longicolle]